VKARGVRHSGRLAQHAGLFLTIAGLYALGAELSWRSFGASVGLAFFPPAGITVAVLVLTERRWWPTVLAAVAVTEVAVDLQHGLVLGIAAGYAAANVVEPLVSVVLLRRLQPGGLDLRRRPDALTFLLAACLAGPAVGGLVGATTKVLDGNGGGWLLYVLQWCAGDGVAVLTIGTTVLLLWRSTASVTRPVELATTVAAMAAASLATFFGDLPPGLLPLALIVWAAFRVGAEGVALSATCFAIVANYATAAGHGIIADWDASPSARLAMTQLSIATVMLAGWFLAVEINERIEAVAARTLAQAERDEAAVVTAVLQLAVRPEPPGSVPNLAVGGIYRPASDAARIGGDWYDVVVLPKDRVLLAVGDVVGHGLEAVEDMTQLRFATRALAIGRHTPAAILTELAAITASATRGRFATAVVALYDPQLSNLTYSSAGHPPPALRRTGSPGVDWLDTSTGNPLGHHVDRPYEDIAVGLAAGDLVVLYSDGMIEQRGEHIDEGLGRLARSLAGWTGADDIDLDLDRLCHRLIDDCRDGAPQTDDLCVLAATPVGATGATAPSAGPSTASPDGSVRRAGGSA
jgi:serine phosphatase RsbU (regulator of sigma subunit)/integral membrane sensor domain MASE1